MSWHWFKSASRDVAVVEETIQAEETSKDPPVIELASENFFDNPKAPFRVKAWWAKDGLPPDFYAFATPEDMYREAYSSSCKSYLSKVIAYVVDRRGKKHPLLFRGPNGRLMAYPAFKQFRRYVPLSAGIKYLGE